MKQPQASHSGSRAGFFPTFSLLTALIFTLALGTAVHATDVPAGGAIIDLGAGSNLLNLHLTNRTDKYAFDVTVTIYTETPGGTVPNISGMDDQNSEDDIVDDNNNGLHDESEDDQTANPPGTTCRSIFGSGIDTGESMDLDIDLTANTTVGTKLKVRFSYWSSGKHRDIIGAGTIFDGMATVGIPVGSHLISTDIGNQMTTPVAELHVLLVSPINIHFDSCFVDSPYTGSLVQFTSPFHATIHLNPPLLPNLTAPLSFDLNALAADDYNESLMIFPMQPPYPNVTIYLTPLNPPVIIPPNGGSFLYNINVHNMMTSPLNMSIWIMMRQIPNGIWMAPSLLVNRTLPAGANPTRQRTQLIPSSLQPGNYIYTGFVGTYPNMVWFSNGMFFTKNATGASGPDIGDFATYGDDFGEFATNSSTTIKSPEAFSLLANPNPFNPTTAISYELRAASFVSLKVYDTAGRLVATLVNGWREAGTHEITFDGADLTSGVYLVSLKTQNQQALQKLILLK